MTIRIGLMGGEDWNDAFCTELLGATKNRRLTFVQLTPEGMTGEFATLARKNDFWVPNVRSTVERNGGTFERVIFENDAHTNDRERLASIEGAEWIHVQCVTPTWGMQMLGQSSLRAAFLAAFARSAVVTCGPSASMLMCDRAWDVPPDIVDQVNRWHSTLAGKQMDMAAFAEMQLPLFDCLHVVPLSMCIPHFKKMAPLVTQFLPLLAKAGLVGPGRSMVGMDDDAMLTVDDEGHWRVGGSGSVTVIGEDRALRRFGAGEVVDLPTVERTRETRQ